MQRAIFKQVKPGDRPEADEWNKLTAAVGMLTSAMLSGGSMFEGAGTMAYIPFNEQQMEVLQALHNIANFTHNETAARTYYVDDENEVNGSDPWVDSQTDAAFIADTIDTVILQDERFAVVRDQSAGKNVILPGVRWHIGKLDGLLAFESAAQVSIWEVPPSGVPQDSGLNVIAYDWVLTAGNTLAQGAKVIVIQHQQSGRWYVTSGQC